MPTWMQSVYYVNVYMCVHCTLYIYTYVLHILRVYFTHVYKWPYVFHTCILVYVCIPARSKHAVCDQMHQMDQKLAPLPAIKHLARPETQFSKVKLFLPSSCASSIKNSSPCGNFWKIFFRSKLFSLPWIQLSPHCGKLMRIKIILTP